MRQFLVLAAALSLGACLTPIPKNTGYEVNGSRVRWVGISMGSVLAEVHRVDVRGVDAATFRVIDHDHAVDARQVYHKGDVLPGEDPTTFRVLPEQFAVGSRRVYHQGSVIPGANPATWRRFEGTLFSTDGAGVWYRNAPLEGADAGTFRVRPHVIKWKLHSNEYVVRDARNFYRFNLHIGSVADCGRTIGEGPNWTDGGWHLYWGQEELDYLCADLRLPGEGPAR